MATAQQGISRFRMNFNNPREVHNTLYKYRLILGEDLPPELFMSFVGVLTNARDPLNVSNRITAQDYLGFVGGFEEDLERSYLTDPSPDVKRYAEAWLENPERERMNYLCRTDVNNPFGRNHFKVREPFLLGHVIGKFSGGVCDENYIIFLSNNQIDNLGLERGEDINQRIYCFGNIGIKFRDKFIRALATKHTKEDLAEQKSSGVHVSRALFNDIGLKIGSSFEIIHPTYRFYV